MSAVHRYLGTMGLQQILAECGRLTSGGGAGALASVARRKGSLPMSGTAKMLVTAGGARLGTVGGGCLEGEIIERAHDVIERRVPSVSEHSLNAELAGDYGLTCGGTASMFIEPVYPDDLLAMIYAESLALLATGQRGVMVTGLDWTAGPRKYLRWSDGEGRGTASLSGAAQEYDVSSELPELRDDCLVESIGSAPRLIVFGGGHVGRAIAQAGAFAGWRVTLVDDREEFTDGSRLPFVERAICCDFHDVARVIAPLPGDYCVVATRGHQHDALIVEQLAPLDLRYLGMLGSRRKVTLTRSLLERWGVAPERLDAMHAPVGLSIGADTPEEIAISVVGEMISIRRAGSRRRGGVVSSALARLPED